MYRILDDPTVATIATALVTVLLVMTLLFALDRLVNGRPSNTNIASPGLADALERAMLSWLIAQGPWAAGEPVRITGWEERMRTENGIPKPCVHVTGVTGDGQTIETDFNGSLGRFIDVLERMGAR